MLRERTRLGQEAARSWSWAGQIPTWRDPVFPLSWNGRFHGNCVVQPRGIQLAGPQMPTWYIMELLHWYNTSTAAMFHLTPVLAVYLFKIWLGLEKGTGCILYIAGLEQLYRQKSSKERHFACWNFEILHDPSLPKWIAEVGMSLQPSIWSRPWKQILVKPKITWLTLLGSLTLAESLHGLQLHEKLCKGEPPFWRWILGSDGLLSDVIRPFNWLMIDNH